MGKQIAKAMGLVGMLGLGCGNIEISYRGNNNVPESCKAIAEDAKAFADSYGLRRGGYPKCAERAYKHDNTCTIPAEFSVGARNKDHAANQYCLLLEIEAGKLEADR